jgi:prepilin-type N-terminal cleavage/methylation domain-containing protein
MQKITKIKIKAYSIVEMLVTMAIFSVIITMILQSLFLNVKLTSQINLRSKFNSDLDQLVSLIERDIRNVDYYYPVDLPGFIKGCDATTLQSDCTFSANGINIKWYLDTQSPIHSVRRAKQENLNPQVIDYNSTNILDVEEFEFTINSTENLDSQARLANILVTIKVKPAIPEWTSVYGIDSQVRQISVSTRNYEVKF